MPRRAWRRAGARPSGVPRDRGPGRAPRDTAGSPGSRPTGTSARSRSHRAGRRGPARSAGRLRRRGPRARPPRHPARPGPPARRARARRSSRCGRAGPATPRGRSPAPAGIPGGHGAARARSTCRRRMVRGRRQEQIERPAATDAHGLGGRHVEVVHVGAFLAVHLDGYEPLVEDRGQAGIGERFALHHVAPVAGRVADREEDGPLLVSRPGERLFPPRMPVHRVVGVLEEVGALLADQAVGPVAGLRLAGRSRVARGHGTPSLPNGGGPPCHRRVSSAKPRRQRRAGFRDWGSPLQW